MLQSLQLEDFKSFHDEKILLSRLTLLIGANASGKSNIFDAIRFLQGVGLGLPFADVLRGRWEGGRELWPGIRGGAAEIARSGADLFGIASGWVIDGVQFEHHLECTVAGVPRLVRERLHSPDLANVGFDAHPVSRENHAELVAGSGINVVPSSSSVLGHYIAMAQQGLPAAVPKLLEAMRGPIFLDISPPRMRDYVSKSSTQLGVHGDNLSAIVWQICQDPEGKTNLLDWISELVAPQLADIDFVETDLGDVMVVMVEQDGTRISARSLSDGTLRFLGELTALLTAPKDSVVLVEEIENGLHPARAHLLVELLSGLTSERGIQVIATTHSPGVLAALVDTDPEMARHTVVCGRIPGSSGTITRPLGELPHYEEVLARRGIEHLFTTRWMERAL
jgi:hypothetical protein